VSQVLIEERPQQLRHALRRYAAVAVVLAVLGAVAGAAYASSRPHVYSSSARILISPSAGNPLSPDTGSSGQQVTIAMTTEAALVDSDPVLALANQQLKTDLQDNQIAVSVPPNTQIVLVTAKTPSAEQSKAVAQAVATSYLAYRKKVTDATRATSVNQLTKRITAVKKELTTASDKAAATSFDPKTSRQIQVLTEQLISLQDSLSTAESIASDPGTLVAPAELGVAQGVAATLFVVAGGLVGLLVGLALVLWLGRRDKRVDARSSSVVAGVPVLAVFGDGRGKDSAVTDRQAYQRLRTSILASTALPSAVAVSGVGRKDSSTSVAMELGRSMTRAGYRVALVVAAVNEPNPFGDDARFARGLSQALRDEEAVASLLVEHDGLMVLPAGSGIVEQQELLSGERFGQVVKTLKSSFDYVLVVTGPLVLPAELATARLADAVLLVGRDRASSSVDVGDIAARAQLVSLRVVGLALRARRDARTAQGESGLTATPPGAGSPKGRAAQPGPPQVDRTQSTTVRRERGPLPGKGRAAHEGT
jgi:polysaccharide biosynthesis transport protein